MKYLPDVIGLGGYVATCVGVGLVAGIGWALIVAGAPLGALYFWNAAVLARSGRSR